MKKLLITGVFVLMLTFTAQAQWSVVGGLNFISVDLDGFAGNANDTAVFGGISYEIPTEGDIGIQPSAIISLGDITSLYIPVMFQYAISDEFKAEAGPQINYILEEAFGAEFGIDLALGGQYDISEDFYVFARYAFQITRGDQEVSGFNLGYDINTFSVGGGYRFN